MTKDPVVKRAIATIERLEAAHTIERTLLGLDAGEATWTQAGDPITLQALLAQPAMAAAPYLLVQREHDTGAFTLEPAADLDAALEAVSATAMGDWSTLLLLRRIAGSPGVETLPFTWHAHTEPPPATSRSAGDRLRRVIARIGGVFPDWRGSVLMNNRLTPTFDPIEVAHTRRFAIVGWSEEDEAVVVDTSETMEGIAFMVPRDGWSNTVRFGVFDLVLDREPLFPLRAESAARRSNPTPPAPKRKR